MLLLIPSWKTLMKSFLAVSGTTLLIFMWMTESLLIIPAPMLLVAPRPAMDFANSEPFFPLKETPKPRSPALRSISTFMVKSSPWVNTWTMNCKSISDTSVRSFSRAGLSPGIFFCFASAIWSSICGTTFLIRSSGKPAKLRLMDMTPVFSAVSKSLGESNFLSSIPFSSRMVAHM